MTRRSAWCCLFIGLLLLPTGCTPQKKKRNNAAIKAEAAECFEVLKDAIGELREGRTDKFWNLLSEASQAEAGKRAKAFRADFAKREKAEQDDIAAQLGVRADELREKLNGFGYVRIKSEVIYKEYWMVAGAAIDHPQIESDDVVTIYYKPDEAEQKKDWIRFVLEDGEWKADLKIP